MSITYRYIEFDVIYPDPELTFTTQMADIPLTIQEMIFGNKIDDNGVLVRSATDKPPYFAVGFKSEKANHKYRFVWLYKVRAKPVTENYATKEGTTITRQTGEVSWTAIKRTHDGQYQAIADESENGFTPEKGKTFLESVYEPSLLGGPLSALSLAPEDGEGSVLGKTVSELQSGIIVSDSAISGTLHYVEDYANFSSVGDEQEGNYLAVKVEADADTTVKFHLVGGSRGEVTLPPDDRQVVCRIRDKSSQSIRVTAQKGRKQKVLNYSLTGLTLETKDG